MENVIRGYKLIIAFILISSFSYAQSSNQTTLKKALLDIAKKENVNLIFNSKNIPDVVIEKPSSQLNLDQKLNFILEGLDISYEIKNDQIFLFKRHKIYGYIEELDSGQRLIGATVIVNNGEELAISNDYGNFSVSTIKDSAHIEVSYIGFATFSQVVTLNEMNKPFIIKLRSDNNIEEVIISDALSSDLDKQYIELDKGSDIHLDQNQAISAVGGEPDIFQAFTRQTGVNAGTDGIGGIHVRGGKNDQNLILLDGVKLYNSAHAFGIYSIVNNTIIDQARLSKSGANGAISGRLSSIMDIKIKDPNLLKPKGVLQFSTLATQANIELPIIKDRMGIMVTGRRTHVDPIIKSISRSDKRDNFEEGESNYSFSDFNVKIYSKISSRDRLYATFYDSNDGYSDYFTFDEFDDETSIQEQTINYNWSNRLFSLRYNSILSSKTFANIQASFYNYNYQNKLVFNLADYYYAFFDRIYEDFTSGITSYELRTDFETILDNSSFKYGANFSIKDYQVGNLLFEDNASFSNYIPFPEIDKTLENFGEYNGQEINLYLTNKFKIDSKSLLSSGIYLNLFSSQNPEFEEENASYINAFGYLKAKHQIGTHTFVGASIGTFVQSEHLLTTGDNGYPSDIWVPSTFYTPPERSFQSEIFVNSQKGPHSIGLSLFYKKQDGLVFYDTIPSLPSVTILNSFIWEGQTVLGSSTGYGLEAEYNYSSGDRLAFKLAYTFNKTDYTFEFINDGRPFPFDYSIPHTIALGSNIKLGRKTNMSLDWIYISGKPYTLYSSEFPFTPLERQSDVFTFQVSDYNALRLPASHKLSASISHWWHWGKVRNDVSIGVQNIYNRRNVLYEYDLIDSGIQQQHGFPILPNLKWKCSF